MLQVDPGGCSRGLGRTRSVLAALLLAGAALAPARGVSAQTVWESPRLLAPAAIGGLGLFYVRYSALPGDGRGAFITYQPASFPRGVSLRGGAARGAGGTAAFFGGVDVNAPIAAHTETRPVDLSWNTGAGFAVGEYLLVSVPVGVAAGHEWTSGSVWLDPYVGVRASMDLRLGEDAPPDEFDLSPGLDLGLDAAFDRSRSVLLRFSVSLGDRSALAVGAAFGG